MSNHRVVVIGSGFGGLTTVSRFSAVVKIGPLQFGGFFGWTAWLALHLARMVGFKSKITTLISWTFTFLTMKRGQLTITEQQIFTRVAAQRTPVRSVS
jgi:NADH dehydrogenase